MRRTVMLSIAASGQSGGPCAWAATLTSNGRRRDLTGGSVKSSHNRQLWRALIKALNALKEPCIVLGYTNAQWLVDVMNKQPDSTYANDDLYREARAAALEHRLEMHHRADVRTQRDMARKVVLNPLELAKADEPTKWQYEQVDDTQMELF